MDVPSLSRLSAGLVAVATMLLVMASPAVAETEPVPTPQCAGASGVIPLGVSLARFQLNSCEADELVDSLDDTMTGTGIATLLGARSWKFGVAGGVVSAITWYDQKTLEACAAPKRGVSFVIAASVLNNCQSQ